MEESKRNYIDRIRRTLESWPCRTPDNHEIKLEKDDKYKIATITFTSGSRNALSGKMISKLTEILDIIEQWTEARGVLLKGYGNTFCSGSDLFCVNETASHLTGLHLAEIMQFNLMRIQKLPIVSVAFINGSALGGGAELAMGADLRVVTSEAKIGFVHATKGVCCGWGGGSRLVQLVGPSRAMDLLASGRKVGAEEAIQLGLANCIVENVDEAKNYLASHIVGPAHTRRAIKSIINSARLLPFEQAVEVEGQQFASTWGTEEHLNLVGEWLESHQKKR